jgi:hypothetical protein
VKRVATSSIGAATLALALLTSPSFAADEPADGAPAADEPGPTKTDREVAVPVPEPGEEQDNMRYPPSSARIGLIAGGVGILGLAYGLTALCASTWPEVPGSDVMYVPVIGPWGALVQSGCAEGEDDCTAMLVLRTILLVLDGFAQAGGAGLVGEGIFMTTEAEGPDSARWMVAPLVAPGQAGVGVVGSF